MRKGLFILLVFPILAAFAQEKPKLIVGIVVDQMRQDYLFRYYNDFEEGGFKRLVKNGYVFRNAQYNYMPTKTGPGHASIYTGTTPARHGIVGNDWYVRQISRDINCVEDTLATVVGGVSNGEVSPANLQTTTITDELLLYYNFQSKVVGVSLKDRGAVLPAGHNPTGAYWYDLQSGNMITSTHYREVLPKWVQRYNKKKRPNEWLSKKWELLRDPKVYNESIDDENPYEQELRKGSGVTFPYDLAKFKQDPSLLKYTPFANTLVQEMAIEAVKGEQLGMDSIPDFLCVSFSATDDLGHRYGPRSMEIQDTYLRLDQEISELLTFLDNQLGEESYLLFLTADHGATDVPAYLFKNKMPSGYHNNGYIRKLLEDHLDATYGTGDWVKRAINEQIYLNRSLAVEKGIDFSQLKEEVIQQLMSEDYISEAFDAALVAKRIFTDPVLIKLQNGYDSKRSGDVLYLLTNSDLNDSYGRGGSDHRTLFNYDTHVPVIFFGKGIKKGESFRSVSITDIAPTLSLMLQLSLPSGSTGEPLLELFE